LQSKHIGVTTHELDLSGSRDVIGHVTILIPYRPFPIGGPLERSI